MEKNILRPFMDILEKIIFPIQSVCIYCSVLTVFITVMAREVFKYSIVWGYEIACFFVIVLLFIGMPVNLHHNTNLKVTALYDHMPPENTVSYEFTPLCDYYICSDPYGDRIQRIYGKVGHIALAASKFPNWLYYGSIGIGIFLSILEMITEFLDFFVKKDNKQTPQ